MNTIMLEKRDAVAIITLNRPHVRNAISLEMAGELKACLSRMASDDSCKVVILTGAGQAFVSGGDLEQFGAARGKEEALPLLSQVADVLTLIDTYPKPVIAAINGTAVGGGCELAVSCHFRYAAAEAVLGFVQIGLHITTGWGGGSRLLRKLPEAKALALLLTGERIGAEEARKLGFVDQVFPQETLLEETFSFAQKIARQPLSSIEAYMRLLAWHRSGMATEACIRQEVEQCASLWGSEPHRAAVRRFLEKN